MIAEIERTTHAAASHAAMESLDARSEGMELAAPEPKGRAKVANIELVRRLKALLNRAMPGGSGRWSHSHLARALGCNQAYISTYLAQVDAAGKAAANPPALAMALGAFEDGVESFLGQIADRRAVKDDLFATAISRQFDGFARQVIAARQWGYYHGPGGDGKTCALNQFARRNPLVIMVTAWKWACGAGALGTAIFGQVNRAGQWRHNEPAIPWLVARLKDSERVLMVDNAHQLTLGALTWLGNLHDATGIPIICAGNPSGLERARRDEQLSTRIKQAEAASFGDERGRRAHWKEAAERLLLRDAPDHAAVLMPLALRVMAHKGTMRALQARVALMNSYLERTASTDAAGAFKAAHAALISEGYSLE